MTNATAGVRRASRDAWLLPTLESLVDPPRLEDAIQSGDSLWTAVVQQGLTTDDAILAALSKRFRLAVADLTLVTKEARDVAPESLARKYRFVPLTVTPSTIDIAVADPNDFDCERAVGFATGRAVRMLLASPAQLLSRLDELYQPEKAVDRILEGVAEHDVRSVVEGVDDGAFDLGSEKATERPIIKLVDHILAEGIQYRASDIHLECAENGVHVIYRIDGVLKHANTLPRPVGVPLVSRIKIMSGLDIADRLRPQDGRARVQIDGKRIDLRVSTLPASTGEKVVIRILDGASAKLTLDALGLATHDYDRIQQLVGLREGIVLVTGPTGSGKTTTLYSSLKAIQSRGVNIVTVEDPVEYKLPGIVQVQVNEKAGLTFATALRSILRQDPDVVLIGEIRDMETAGIAIQASLTGHLVLSTLHTIDASSSIARLLDIGIESYKIGAALKGVVAQRLIRRLCPHCRVAVTEPVAHRLAAWIPDGAILHRPAGCDQCTQSGYFGRLAIMEVLVTDSEVERQIAAGATSDRIAECAREAGMRSLWDSGLTHVLDGTTDLEELLRVVEVPVAATRRRSAGRTARRPTGDHAALVDLDPISEVSRQPSASSRGGADGADRDILGNAFELVDDLVDGPNASRPVILVADESAGVRGLLKKRLVDEGFTVVEATDGIEALEEVDHLEPTVLVVDASLPRLDGWGVVKRLRSRLPTAKLPIVMMSGGTDESDEVRAFAAGVNDFVVKPLRPDALAARLKLLVASRQTANA